MKAIIALSVFLPFLVAASKEEEKETSGSIDTSVSATDQEGFTCASDKGRPYLLSAMPQFFASKLATFGLLRPENNGEYRIALMIDENSRLIGYDVGANTNENSRIVQAVLSIEQFPELDNNAKCVAGKVFLYELTLEQ